MYRITFSFLLVMLTLPALGFAGEVIPREKFINTVDKILDQMDLIEERTSIYGDTTADEVEKDIDGAWALFKIFNRYSAEEPPKWPESPQKDIMMNIGNALIDYTTQTISWINSRNGETQKKRKGNADNYLQTARNLFREYLKEK